MCELWTAAFWCDSESVRDRGDRFSSYFAKHIVKYTHVLLYINLIFIRYMHLYECQILLCFAYQSKYIWFDTKRLSIVYSLHIFVFVRTCGRWNAWRCSHRISINFKMYMTFKSKHHKSNYKHNRHIITFIKLVHNQ